MSKMLKGGTWSEEHKIALSLKMKGKVNLAEKNGMWKGNNVSKDDALHDWIKRRLSKPELCKRCNQVPPLDLANKSGEYKRDLSDWEWLCRRCHMTDDGRIQNLKQYKNGTGFGN